MSESSQFHGFTPEAISFLREIGVNNNKPWYEANKSRYREYVLKPFQELVADLSGFMMDIDPYFVTTPAVDKTISRIYRDTRFSKDKSLYRNNVWLTFKRPSQDWKEAPAYYFELSPEGFSYGMGFYSASKAMMDRFRESIARKPEEFLETVAFYREPNPFTLAGETYRRNPPPDLPETIREWYRYKSFHFSSHEAVTDLLFVRELIDTLMNGFGLLAPLYHYLWKFI